MDQASGSLGSFLGRIACKFDRHRPIRAEVTWGGVGYVGTCKYCGTEIVRSPNGVWRADPSAHGEN